MDVHAFTPDSTTSTVHIYTEVKNVHWYKMCMINKKDVFFFPHKNRQPLFKMIHLFWFMKKIKLNLEYYTFLNIQTE